MSECQIIDCCPPTPFDYAIPTLLFWNTQQCATVSCQDGSNSLTRCTAAATVSSSDSQGDADAEAMALALAAAKAALDAMSVCGFWNTRQCYTANCTGGQQGSNTACVDAHSVSSMVSQADADAIALALATQLANSGLSCLFWNTEQCCTVNCPTGQTGSSTYCVPAHTYSSTISQGDANSKAHTAACDQALAQLNCSIVGTLSGLQWKLPCIADQLGGIICSCDPNSDTSAIINGTPGVTYQVRLRIRGAIELCGYTGGTDISDTGGYCVLDGLENNVYPGANIYQILIYESNASTVPIHTYSLNRNTGQNQSRTYAVDYQMVIPMKTGYRIRLYANAVNGTENNSQYSANNTVVPVNPGDPPLNGITSQPYHGQFLQMDVVSVS